jgi:cellulose synthase/poly-beta-1,6-N-acetylglucosamine synthase-like glycosyltransferase
MKLPARYLRQVLEARISPVRGWMGCLEGTPVNAHAHQPPSYVSVDSMPRGFTARRSALVAPTFLVLYGGLSALVALAQPSLTSPYGWLLHTVSRVPLHSVLRPGSSLSVRPFVLLFIILLAAFGSGPLRARLRFAVVSILGYAAASVLIDAVLIDGRYFGLPSPLSQHGGIAAVITALLVLSSIIFTQYQLPEDVPVHPVRRRLWEELLLLLALIAAAVGLDAVSTSVRSSVQLKLPLVNGFSSTVVFFLLCLQGLLFAVGWLRQRTAEAADIPPVSVAFLVPAHNEAGSVQEVIRALDRAAERYDGPARLVLVNNCSSDDTAPIARRALARCNALCGEVVDCDIPGKAHALNYGLSRISEEIVVRVDADTLVEPNLLRQLVPHFALASTGGVSGLPLPRSDAPRHLAPVRLMEALYAVSYLRVGQGAVDGVLVMPGNMSAYRRALVAELGGFGVGFNGEDTDMAIRIGRLGYDVVTDRDIHFHTEVPATIGHLREQRMRWSRGIFHVTGRNRSCISRLQGSRGLWTLPWSFVNASRRSVMLPMLIAAGVAGLVAPGMISLRQVALIGGLVLGVHMAVVVVLLVSHRSPRALVSLPTYFAFRVFKLYVAFEALLTLELRGVVRSLADESPSATRDVLHAPGPSPTPATVQASRG